MLGYYFVEKSKKLELGKVADSDLLKIGLDNRYELMLKPYWNFNYVFKKLQYLLDNKNTKIIEFKIPSPNEKLDTRIEITGILNPLKRNTYTRINNNIPDKYQKINNDTWIWLTLYAQNNSNMKLFKYCLKQVE